MAKVKYLGLTNPKQELEALRPAYRATIKMMVKCKLFSPEYVVLLRITETMNEAAQHFLPRPWVSFFGSRPTGGGQHSGQPLAHDADDASN